MFKIMMVSALLVSSIQAFADENSSPDLSGVEVAYAWSAVGASASQEQKAGKQESDVLTVMRTRLQKGLSRFQYLMPGCEERPEHGNYIFLETNHNGYVLGSVSISEPQALNFIEAHNISQAGFQRSCSSYHDRRRERR